MKKFTQVFAASLISTFALAQMPNPSFETWVNNNESPTTYSVPQGWMSHDVVNSAFAAAFGDSTYVLHSVTQVTSAHTGNYAVQTAVVQSNEMDTVGGVLYSFASAADFFGFAFNGLAEGFTYNQRPANLTGYYKLNSVGGDTAGIQVFMTKWNTSTNSRDILEVTAVPFVSNASNWTAFSIPLTYAFNEFPDTVLIIAGLSPNDGFGGNSVWHPGSTFTLDDFAFTGAVGVEEQQNANAGVSVFPNPFDDQTTLNFKNVQLENATLEIYDVLGNKVKTMGNLSGNNILVNREGMSSGLYFYNVVENGEVVATGKMSVK